MGTAEPSFGKGKSYITIDPELNITHETTKMSITYDYNTVEIDAENKTAQEVADLFNIELRKIGSTIYVTVGK